MRKLLAVLSLALLSCHVMAADTVSLLPEDHGYEIVFFTGAIEAGDAQRIAAAFQKASPKTSHLLMISSPGGRVSEAMKIGNYLEEHEIGVIVPKAMSCKSSCVLVLAGGESKTVGGKIGIHRPFITDLDLPEGAVASAVIRVQNEIRKYLEEKGVAPSLVEDMFSVEPHNMRILTSEEVSRYRLDQGNYIKQEQDDIRRAKRLGLTREEYVQKMARLNAECTKYTGYDERTACINAVMGTNYK